MRKGPILPASGIVSELAVAALPDDERVWVPQAPDVWFRPLLLNTVTGGWCNLLRVRRSGILSRHLIYLDESGRQTGYEDVFSKIEMCRGHYAAAGLGAGFVEQFIR